MFEDSRVCTGARFRTLAVGHLIEAIVDKFAIPPGTTELADAEEN